MQKAKAIGPMAIILKYILGLFILTGIAIALYGLWEVLGTKNFVETSSGRAKATFIGYDHEVVETRSLSPSSTQPGQYDFQDSSSIMSYPRFEYVTKDGEKRQVQESKPHVIEYFKPGQEVEIILSPHWNPRLAGFYSLYVRDLCILVLGLCFILIPLLIWKVAIPSLETPAGMKLAARMAEQYHTILSSKIGPITVGSFLKGIGAFMGAMIIFWLLVSLEPFLKQMRLGFGLGLIKALEQKRFDDAREMIIKKKGINALNEYNQNPLLLALEAGQAELARLLIEAGSDVNIKSKMYMTPLRVATQSGNLEMVRLLLSKGALPDAPEDEFPPAFYALHKGYDEIARVLIEAGTNLNRQYITENRRLTVGDMALLARKPELVELIRRRGGTFTLSGL
ncbi:MAG: hypothetical protein A2156_08075 [Deltaproteobacteria bacterium RBG_16_48_10]|nr:MAG: hypothetical protein A2156_08075 [Deltaproteobacteria bacterium RBG_16_48_10]